jgi:hypothetical protein
VLEIGVVVAALSLGSLSASAQCLTPRGDITGDGITNVVDVQCGVFVSLAANPAVNPPACLKVLFTAVDSNCDSSIDVTDILLLVQHAVNLPINEALDEDGNNCVDDCQVVDFLEGSLSPYSGDSWNETYRLEAIGTGFDAHATSMNGSYALRPLAVGVEPGTGE